MALLRIDGETLRVSRVERDTTNGRIRVDAVRMSAMLSAGIWTDASGQDADGNAIESYWTDANGNDAAGNPVTSVWF